MSVLAILLTIGVGNAWGQTTTTYTFTSKSWGAKIGSTTANWTSGRDGAQFNSSQTPIGLQITEGTTGANGTSPKSFTNVTSVVITYNSSSKGVGNFKVKIGSNTESDALTISKSQSNQTLTFNPASAQSGAIKITATCTKNSFSIVSVAITEASASSVATPTFSVAAGTYTSAQSVSISCATAGSTIYYTIDGTTPTSSSTEYSSAVSISSSCTLKAIAKKGSDYSSVASASYTINIPYTVTFVTGTNNPTVDPVTEESKGEGIELPDGVTPDCSYDGWVFAGWAKTSITEQNTAPRLYMPGDDYYPDDDENLYAVYRKLTSGTSTATFTSSDLSNLTVISSGKWWVHSATGVEFYIHSYGIYDSKFDIWKSWAMIDAHTKIKQVVFTNSDATTIDHIALNSAESSAGGSATISGTTTQTITCSGDVSQLYLYSPASSDSYFTAFTVTYYNAKYNSNPTCATCDADPTIGDASINGSVF